MKLVVLGASGETGRHLVSLAAASGWTVRACIRPGSAAAAAAGAAHERAIGDPTDPTHVEAAVKGADAVAVCLGISRRTRSPFAALVSPPDLTSRSVAAIVGAMRAQSVQRIVYVSAFGASESWADIPWWGRLFIAASKVRYSMADHTRSERMLAASGLDWTALRPMLLGDGRSEQAARPLQPGDSLLAKIPREALARSILECLGNPSTIGRAIPLAAP